MSYNISKTALKQPSLAWLSCNRLKIMNGFMFIVRLRAFTGRWDRDSGVEIMLAPKVLKSHLIIGYKNLIIIHRLVSYKSLLFPFEQNKT